MKENVQLKSCSKNYIKINPCELITFLIVPFPLIKCTTSAIAINSPSQQGTKYEKKKETHSTKLRII